MSTLTTEAPRNLNAYPGADPTGLTDSTKAVKAFFNDLHTYGGHGTARGTFRTSATIVAPGNTGAPGKPFTFDGGRATHFVGRNRARDSFMHLNGATGVTLTGFSLDAGRAETGFSSHGIVAASCTDCTISDAHVTNWQNTAVMVYAAAGIGDGRSHRNRIVNVTADGQAAANNGVMLGDSTHSQIINCRVYNMGYGSPGYALQLKGESRFCTISGGYAEGATAAVAFGQEHGVGASDCIVTGVHARACKHGFIAGYANNNTVDVKIDQNDMEGTRSAVRLEHSSGNTITVDIDRVPPGRNALHLLDSSENVVTVRRLNGYGTRLLNVVSGTYNTVMVGRVTDFNGDLSTLVADASGGTTNKVGYII